MSESKAMLEIRKIKEENSLRWSEMTSEEIKQELDEATEWFVAEMEKRGKTVEIVTPGEARTKTA